MAKPTNETTLLAKEEAEIDLDSTSDSNSESLDVEQEDILDSNVSNTSNGSATQIAPEIPSKSTPSPSLSEAKKPSIEANNPMSENAMSANKSTPQVSETFGNYEDYQLLPEAPWPPPIFVKQKISPQERYYIEHRWYSQWSFFDSKATQNKNRYYRTQLIVGLGSVTVPVLVGINTEGVAGTVLYIVTVVVSLAVAMSTAIESLYTFGDNWRSYRSAAEDLHQEKSLYDVKAGRYADNPQGFLRFVERCEEIIAQQNGRWIQSQEKSAEQAKELGEEFLETYGAQDSDDEDKKGLTVEQVRTTTVAESFTASPVESNENKAETYVDPNAVDPATPTSYG